MTRRIDRVHELPTPEAAAEAQQLASKPIVVVIHSDHLAITAPDGSSAKLGLQRLAISIAQQRAWGLRR